MEIDLEWPNLAEWQGALRGVEDNIDTDGVAALGALAALAQSEAQANFVGSHKRGAPHIGGARPNVVTGNLRRSITRTSIERTGDGYMTRVYPSAIYGRAVELGVPGRSRAFPYFAPAMRVVRLRATDILAEHWSRHV